MHPKKMRMTRMPGSPVPCRLMALSRTSPSSAGQRGAWPRTSPAAAAVIAKSEKLPLLPRTSPVPIYLCIFCQARLAQTCWRGSLGTAPHPPFKLALQNEPPLSSHCLDKTHHSSCNGRNVLSQLTLVGCPHQTGAAHHSKAAL